MQGKFRLLFLAVFLMVLVASVFAPQTTRRVSSDPFLNNVLVHALDIESGRAKRAKYEQTPSSGALYTVLQASGELDKRAHAGLGLPFPSFFHRGTQGCPHLFTGTPNNTRVNQDCSLRRQAEEVVAINPTDPKNLIAGANDSRVGFNHCSYAWSFDGGITWGDQIPPFFEFVLEDGH